VELASPATRASSEPLAAWAVKKIRLDGLPFRFEGHEYLRAIYDDTSSHVVLCKAAQIGGTTWAILRAFHACLSGLNCMYFFPTRTDVLEFSKSRVSPLIEENAFLKKLVNDTDAAGLKRIGDAHLYLRGMQSTVGMKSVPADMVVFDELDEATPEAKAIARERLSHSDYKRIVELSNPSLPDYGVDQSYQMSDQRHWTLKCPHCNEWTALDREFPLKLGQEVRIILPRPDGNGYYHACPKCSGELDLTAGEWVADFPGRPIHGYRISQLFSSKVDPGEILNEYRLTRYPDRFYQLKIGIPWADLDRRLDVGTVLALCSDAPMEESSNNHDVYVMGVDTGLALHTVILRCEYSKDGEWNYTGRQYLVHLGMCHEFSELDELIKRFKIHKCVIDGLPETHATREFAKRHRGRVFMNFFVESERGAANWDRDTQTVRINRTEALDSSRAAVKDKRLILPRQIPIVEEFARHMASDAKVLDEDEETGAKKYRYLKTGTDHFSLAFTYGWMASESGWGGPRVRVLNFAPKAKPFPFTSTFDRWPPPRGGFGGSWPFR
jgi:hypothetical protein